MFPEQDVKELELTVEDGFKYIISMGVVVPMDEAKNNLANSKLAQKTVDS